MVLGPLLGMLLEISPAQPRFLVLLRHGDLKSGLLENSTGSEICPGFRLPGNSIMDEDNRMLEIPAWEKRLPADAEAGEFQCRSIILLLRGVNKVMMEQNA
jgi:hypothetical protein